MPKRARKTPPRKKERVTDTPTELSDEETRFAVEYAAAEIETPSSPGNATRAYLCANTSPGGKPPALKTAQNQGLTWRKRPRIAALIESLLLEGKGAEHIVYTPAFLARTLYEAIDFAREQKDGATIGRLVELADRNCVGGPRLIKQTKSTSVRVNKFEGKTPTEIRAMKEEARRILSDGAMGDDADASRTDEMGAGGGGGEPLH